jgi:uncharacterized protein YcbK (DUF882 family)
MDLPKIITNSRRNFLKNSFGLLVATSQMGGTLFAADEVLYGAGERKKTLRQQINSKEKVILVERFGKQYSIPFADSNGTIIRDGYETLSRVFGDYKAYQAIPMDIDLFRILYFGQNFLFENGYKKPFILTSGYRTYQTNASTEGAALGSQHIKGKAIDGVIDGLSPLYMGQLFRACGAGGIGVYGNFVHFDTGATRSWFGHKKQA